MKFSRQSQCVTVESDLHADVPVHWFCSAGRGRRRVQPERGRPGPFQRAHLLVEQHFAPHPRMGDALQQHVRPPRADPAHIDEDSGVG